MTGRQGEHDHGNAVAQLIRQTLDAVRPGLGAAGRVHQRLHRRPARRRLAGVDELRRVRPAGLVVAAVGGLRGQPARHPRTGWPAGPAGPRWPTMREFAAAVPWKVALPALEPDQFPRHRPDQDRDRVGGDGPDRCRAAVHLPGNADGVRRGRDSAWRACNGEDSRRPMPWHRPETWDHATLDAYRDLIAVRQAHPALRRGGLRWVIETDDAMGFLRETADERILVVVLAHRGPVSLLPASLAPTARPRPSTARSISDSPAGAIGGPRHGPGRRDLAAGLTPVARPVAPAVRPGDAGAAAPARSVSDEHPVAPRSETEPCRASSTVTAEPSAKSVYCAVCRWHSISVTVQRLVGEVEQREAPCPRRSAATKAKIRFGCVRVTSTIRAPQRPFHSAVLSPDAARTAWCRTSAIPVLPPDDRVLLEELQPPVVAGLLAVVDQRHPLADHGQHDRRVQRVAELLVLGALPGVLVVVADERHPHRVAAARPSRSRSSRRAAPRRRPCRWRCGASSRSSSRRRSCRTPRRAGHGTPTRRA